MIYIKDMDMPVDCLGCRISCKHESYMVIGRPSDCPLAEAPVGDLISRADAIEAVRLETAKRGLLGRGDILNILSALPSADAVSREEYERLEALYDAIRIYDSSAEAVQGEWIDKTNDESLCDEWECSKCGNWTFVKTNFCPHCGARMTKGGDSE